MNELEQVANRFMSHWAVALLGLSKKDVKRVLTEHAKQAKGCVSCAYSSPYRGAPFNWVVRDCVLGLRQDGCPMYKPMI